MMHPQVFISGLILLLPGALGSYIAVEGVVGHPVTLPCNYSTNLGITTTCWGLGECQAFYCARTLIWTNGYQVTYQRSSRYQLKGQISEGIVSLTIENAVQSDSGPYCCIVEIPGSFRYGTYSLEIKPDISTSPPTRSTTARRSTTIRPTTTGWPTTIGRTATTGRPTTAERPTTTGNSTTAEGPTIISTRPTHVPTLSPVSMSTPPTPAHTQTHIPEPTTFYPHQTTAEVTETPSYTLADWNYTVTSSDNTESIPSQKQQNMNNSFFYIGFFIAALLMLLLVCTMAVTRYILMKKKLGSQSLVAFRVSKMGALQNTVVVRL